MQLIRRHVLSSPERKQHHEDKKQNKKHELLYLVLV